MKRWKKKVIKEKEEVNKSKNGEWKIITKILKRKREMGQKDDEWNWKRKWQLIQKDDE